MSQSLHTNCISIRAVAKNHVILIYFNLRFLSVIMVFIHVVHRHFTESFVMKIKWYCFGMKKRKNYKIRGKFFKK